MDIVGRGVTNLTLLGVKGFIDKFLHIPVLCISLNVTTMIFCFLCTNIFVYLYKTLQSE